LDFHLVAQPADVIDALLEKFRTKHVQNETSFCNLDHRPRHSACLSVAILYNPNSIDQRKQNDSLFAQNIWDLRPLVSVEPSRGSMKKRGRRRIRSAEYWRAYLHPEAARMAWCALLAGIYTRKQREQRAARRLARRQRKQKVAVQMVHA